MAAVHTQRTPHMPANSQQATSDDILSCEIVAPNVIHYLGCHGRVWSPSGRSKHYGRCGGKRCYQEACACCVAYILSREKRAPTNWPMPRHVRARRCTECELMGELMCLNRTIRDMTRRYNGVSLPLGAPRPLKPPRTHYKVLTKLGYETRVYRLFPPLNSLLYIVCQI